MIQNAFALLDKGFTKNRKGKCLIFTLGWLEREEKKTPEASVFAPELCYCSSTLYFCFYFTFFSPMYHWYPFKCSILPVFSVVIRLLSHCSHRLDISVLVLVQPFLALECKKGELTLLTKIYQNTIQVSCVANSV